MGDEKKVIKLSFGKLLIGIAVLVIVTFLGTNIYLNAIGKPNIFNLSLTDQEEFKASEEKEIGLDQSTFDSVKKLNENRDIVYSIFEDKKSDDKSYDYKIPGININSSEVKKINSEIERKYKEIADVAIQAYKEGEAIGTLYIKYSSYINNNILSLVIEMGNQFEQSDYDVYNIDIYTGKIVANNEILKMKNISQEDFLNKLADVHKNRFIELYGTEESFLNNMKSAPASFTEEEIKTHEESYIGQYNDTISKDNYGIDIPIFLDSDGSISIIAKIYSLAGAKWYLAVIDTNI